MSDPPVVACIPPDPLNTQEFTRAWESYVAYRRESGLKPLKAASVITKWAELASWGHDRAIAGITASIANGWTGIFEPKENRRAKPANHRADKAAAECPEGTLAIPITRYGGAGGASPPRHGAAATPEAKAG